MLLKDEHDQVHPYKGARRMQVWLTKDMEYIVSLNRIERLYYRNMARAQSCRGWVLDLISSLCEDSLGHSVLHTGIVTKNGCVIHNMRLGHKKSANPKISAFLNNMDIYLLYKLITSSSVCN